MEFAADNQGICVKIFEDIIRIKKGYFNGDLAPTLGKFLPSFLSSASFVRKSYACVMST